MMAPGVDVSRLDPGRLVALEDQAEAALAGLHTASRRVEEASTATRRLEAEVERLRLAGHAVPPPEVAAELDACRTRAHIARERLAALTEELRPLLQLRARVGEFAREHVLRTDGIAPTLPHTRFPKPATFEQLAATRSQIEAAREEIGRLKKALWSRTEGHAAIGSALDSLVDAATLSAAAFLKPTHAGRFRLLRHAEDAAVPVAATLRAIEGLLVLIGRDRIEERLQEAADTAAVTRGGWGTSSAERDARVAALEARLLALELHEEAILEDLDARGSRVARRGDADPQAVLARADVDLPAIPETPASEGARSQDRDASPGAHSAASSRRRRLSKYLSSTR